MEEEEEEEGGSGLPGGRGGGTLVRGDWGFCNGDAPETGDGVRSEFEAIGWWTWPVEEGGLEGDERTRFAAEYAVFSDISIIGVECASLEVITTRYSSFNL